MTQNAPLLNADQQAVLEVIENDLSAYLARDREKWEHSWVKDQRFQSFMECGTLQIARSYGEFRDNVFDAMDAAGGAVEAEIHRENVCIEIRGSVAWATFDQMVSDTSDPFAPPNLSHNVRLLEFEDGRWRIVFHGVWSQSLRDIASPAIEVGPNCEVVWMNAEAARSLPDFAGFTVSNGTLRTMRPSWQESLLGTVQRAHALTRYGRYNIEASEGGGKVVFPVVLGEDEDGALLVCWVRVADGRVYILFGETPDLSNQIDVARVIFTLSDTQSDIVRLIALGFDLAEIAERLGVTKNTARTHLRRAFDKVGVHSQIELLRRLVSFSV